MENKFKEKLYNFEGTPSLKVWDGIEKSLDKRKSSRNWIYAGLGVVAISIGAFLFLSQSGTEKRSSAINNPITHHQVITETKSTVKALNTTTINGNKPDFVINLSNHDNTPQINNITPQNLIVANEIKTNFKSEIPSESLKQEQLNEKKQDGSNKDLFPVLKIQIVSDMMPMYIDPMFRNLVMTFRNPEVENNVRENIYQLKGFHFGLSGVLNNTYILNQNTYNEFSGKNLATKFTYGDAYSLNLGYDFNSRYGIQTEVIINASKGQKFEDVYNGAQVSRDINLKYDEVPVFIKYKMSNMSTLTKRPSVLNFISGLEYGYLESGNENLMGINTDITNRFNHNDISMLAGLEYNLYFGKHFFFAAGARVSYSLLDINAPGWKLEQGSGSTRNMILGGNFGINYLLN